MISYLGDITNPYNLTMFALKKFDDILNLKPGDICWDHHNGIPGGLIHEDVLRQIVAPTRLVDELIARACANTKTCPTNKLVNCLEIDESSRHTTILLGCRYDDRAYLFSIFI